MADVRRGMKPDEAFVKNYGGAGAEMLGAFTGGALGLAGGAIVGGPVGGVAGGAIGAGVGARVGEHSGKGLLPAYRLGKEQTAKTVEHYRQLARELAVYDTPRFWLNRRGPTGAAWRR